MLKIGKARYPNEWTGAEPTTPIFLPLPLGSAAAKEWQKQEAHVALCKECPEFGRKSLHALPYHSNISLRGFSKGSPIIPPFTDSEWQAAREIYRRREDAARPAWNRFAQVKKIVTDACRQGQLAFALRPRAGGAVYPGRADWWETEGSTLHYRFEWFRMSRAAPFANGLRDDADWICIGRGSLDTLLKSPATARGESDAVRALTSKLKENPDLTRAEALDECKQFGIGHAHLTASGLKRANVRGYQRPRRPAASGRKNLRAKSPH